MGVILWSYIEEIYQRFGLEGPMVKPLALVTLLLLLLGTCYVFVHILMSWITPIFQRLSSRTATVWDDYLLDVNVLKHFWHLLSAVLLYKFVPDFDTYHIPYVITNQLLKILIVVFATQWVTSFLDKLSHHTSSHEKTQHQTLVGVIQFVKLLVYSLSAILIVSFAFGKNPVNLIAGLGAMATVLMLVFKDSIMGLVAGIQLSANKMLKPGDWVAIEKLHINGRVEKVSLTTVKIRNFDNTISTVPPYTLVSDSFRNWENMFEMGSRQVKRSFNIDTNTIRFVTDEEKIRLYNAQLITLEEANSPEPMVNLTLFRSYAQRMLSSHPDIKREPWLLVRLLQATSNGVPIEFYFFLSDTNFEPFENKSAICQEQLIATLPYFGLRVYQAVSGYDMQKFLDGQYQK